MIGFSEDDALAAEYALGTLDGAERAAARSRRETDAGFDASVRDWEIRLAPLAEAAQEIVPPPRLFGAILTRLSLSSEGQSESNIIQLRRRIHVWRGVAAAASALAAVFAVWIAHMETQTVKTGPQTYVAVLQQGAGAPSFVVSVDLEQRRMAVMPLGATAPADKSFQLWMIGADHGTPQSLGLIDSNAPAHPVLPRADSGLISTATYAVTIEPHGGSPTGQPTSAPVFTGKLLDVAN